MDTKYYTVAEEMIKRGYVGHGWSVDQLAEKLADKAGDAHTNRHKLHGNSSYSGSVLSSNANMVEIKQPETRILSQLLVDHE